MKTFAISALAIATVFIANMAHAQTPKPIPGSCSEPFFKPKNVGSNSLGQDRCVDGLVTPIRTSPVHCDCQSTCSYDDGSTRSRCIRCPGKNFTYEDEFTDSFCEEHGGADNSQWYVTGFFQGYGMWQGPTSTLSTGALEGPDLMECRCINGTKSACIDFDAGAQTSGFYGIPDWSSVLCHDVCGWAGSLAQGGGEVEKDSPSCVGVENPDRGPEVHCMCDGRPLPDTWCTDDPNVCEERGCVLHHTSDVSNRCIPVPSVAPVSTTTTTTLPSNECAGVQNAVTAALNWLLFATGQEYDCVDHLR